MECTDHHESENEIISANQEMDRKVAPSSGRAGLLGRTMRTIRATAGRVNAANPLTGPHAGKGLAGLAEKAKRAPRDG